MERLDSVAGSEQESTPGWVRAAARTVLVCTVLGALLPLVVLLAWWTNAVVTAGDIHRDEVETLLAAVPRSALFAGLLALIVGLPIHALYAVPPSPGE